MFLPFAALSTRLCQFSPLLLATRRLLSLSSPVYKMGTNSPTPIKFDLAEIERIRYEFSDPKYAGGQLRLFKRDDGIGLLRIEHYSKKNCFSGCMMAQLTTILEELVQWKEGRAVILYGQGGFFSSGGDLDTVRQISDTEGGRKMITLMQYNLAKLESLPLITVAYVRGMAIGGGAELLTACDIRLSTDNAVLGFVQARIGIPTVWGGGSRLVRQLGYHKALDMIATGRTMIGTEALHCGFIDHLVGYDDSLDEDKVVVASALQFLQPYLAHPKSVVETCKKIAVDAYRRPIHEALECELQHGLKIWGGEVHSKALAGKVNHKKKN